MSARYQDSEYSEHKRVLGHQIVRSTTAERPTTSKTTKAAPAKVATGRAIKLSVKKRAATA